ncbi:hypothetical protein BGZ94_002314, partial [Podila epigama]
TRLSVNERPVKRLIAKLLKWSESLIQGKDEEVESGMKLLLQDVAQLQLLLTKSKLVYDMTERERISYDQERQTIESKVASSQEELERLERELMEAKKIRANKIEYDELAVQVLQYPSRAASQSNIETLQNEIQELEMMGQAQIEKMAQRREQFFTALASLRSIQESISEDSREEARRLFLKRTQVDDDDDDDFLGDGFGADGTGSGNGATPSASAHVTTGQATPTATGGANGGLEEGEGDDTTLPSTSEPSATLRFESTLKASIEPGHSLSRSTSSGSLSESQVLLVNVETDGLLGVLGHQRRSTNGSLTASPAESQSGAAGEDVFSSEASISTAQHHHGHDPSKKRKERLEQLRKRKLESTSNGDKDVSLSFRNYDPLNENLKAADSKIMTHKDIGETVESKMDGVVEKVIQEEDDKRAKDVDIFTLAPKKPNWDLKRDIEPKLLKLEKKTRAAIIELIRKERPSDLILAE